MAVERFLVTDVTRMHNQNACIAGFIGRDGVPMCVRPVLSSDRNFPETWLDDALGPIRPFSILELDFGDRVPASPHVEDQQVDIAVLAHHGEMPVEYRADFLDSTKSTLIDVFGDALRTTSTGKPYVMDGTDCSSLTTITPEFISIECYFDRKWHYRAIVNVSENRNYDIAITDLAAQRYIQSQIRIGGLSAVAIAQELTRTLNEADQLFLRIGLARARDDDHRCYLLVTGIFSFPDYLDGRCHADFSRDLG